MVLVLLGFVSSSPALAATVVVDPGGGGDALTIAEGLALAADGDTMLIEPGAYTESGLATRLDSLEIAGAGPSVTIIDGTSSDGTALPSLCRNVNISGVGFVADPTDWWSGVAQEHAGWDGADTDVSSVVGCRFEAFSDPISIFGGYDTLCVLDSVFYDDKRGVVGSDHSTDDLHIENNVFLDVLGGPAVSLESADGDPIANHHTIVHNTFVNIWTLVSRSGGDGYPASLTFAGNTALQSHHGVSIGHERGDTIADNVFAEVDGGFLATTYADEHNNIEQDPLICDWREGTAGGGGPALGSRVAGDRLGAGRRRCQQHDRSPWGGATPGWRPRRHLAARRRGVRVRPGRSLQPFRVPRRHRRGQRDRGQWRRGQRYA